MDEYDIYIRGFAPYGEAPEIGLRRVFGIDAKRARELVLSLPRVVKRRIAAEQLPRYERALIELGADYELRPSPLRPQQIAVVGSAGAREDESGLLTLPPETPAAPAQRAAPRFSQTVVGNLEQATLARPGAAPVPETARTQVAQAPQMTQPGQTSSRPSPPAVRDPRPSARAPGATAQWGTELPSASGWTPIKPASNRPRDAGDVPPPPPVELNIGLGGRPEWLVHGPDSYQESMPRAPSPSLQPTARTTGMRESVPALASKRPPPVGPATPLQQPRPQVQFAAGAAHAQDAGPSQLPMPLRIGLRIALGAMLFVVISALRHCHVLDRGVERALSSWGKPAEERPGEPSARAPAIGGEAGPIAHDWMESDLHLFTNGDKDRVRNLILRLEEAGASEVRVARIMRNGMVQIAAELVVVLPTEADKRKAVFAEYEKFMRGTFGDFVSAPRDDGRDVMRIAL